MTETRTIGDRLASGASWTKDEINKGFGSFDRGFADLAHDLGATTASAAQ